MIRAMPLSRSLQILHVLVLLVLPTFLLLKLFEVTEEAVAAARQLIGMQLVTPIGSTVQLSANEREHLLQDWNDYYKQIKADYQSRFPSPEETVSVTGLTTDRKAMIIADPQSVSRKQFNLFARPLYAIGRRLDDPSFWIVFSCGVAAWLVSVAARRLEYSIGSVAVRKALCGDEWAIPRAAIVITFAATIYLVRTYHEAEAIFYGPKGATYNMSGAIPSIQLTEGLLNLVVIIVMGTVFSIAWTLGGQARQVIASPYIDRPKRCNIASAFGLLRSAAFAPAIALITFTAFFTVVNRLIGLRPNFFALSDVVGVVASLALFVLPFCILSLATLGVAGIKYGWRWGKGSGKPYFSPWVADRQSCRCGEPSANDGGRMEIIRSKNQESDPSVELFKELISFAVVLWHFGRLSTTWHVVGCWYTGCEIPTGNGYWSRGLKTMASLRDRFRSMIWRQAPSVPREGELTENGPRESGAEHMRQPPGE